MVTVQHGTVSNSMFTPTLNALVVVTLINGITPNTVLGTSPNSHYQRSFAAAPEMMVFLPSAKDTL